MQNALFGETFIAYKMRFVSGVKMKDFKNYIPNDNDKNSTTRNKTNFSSMKNGGNQNGANYPKEVNSALDLAKNLSSSMKGKSESQLIQNIISEAEKGKREGRLTNTDLDKFYNSLSPLLDPIKRRKLKEVISRLKSI